MEDKTIYIIAGCNGAGKTTASFTILPEILNCKEFVNADEIARGLSPFQPEKVAFESGRIMLERINTLLGLNESFAFETTLATKTYRDKLIRAKEKGYIIKLLFYWLPTIEMAIDRVAIRVSEGGHNIPIETIIRRYKRGIYNFKKIYLPLSDEWMVFNNSESSSKLVASGKVKNIIIVHDIVYWEVFKSKNEK